MAAMPIYGKNLKTFKILSYRNVSPMIMKLGMEYNEPKLYTGHINDDPKLILTYFTAMANLAKLVWTYGRPRY